jgi:predicted RNA-binding Zn ribbon-like protein
MDPTAANATRPRRPPGARTATAADPFGSPAAAAALLEPLGLARPPGPAELDDLRALSAETQAITQALASGAAAPGVDVLNRLAAQATATQSLRVGPGGRLTADVSWHAGTAAAELACRIVAELSRLDPTRLRHCAREACDLLYYDTTRSRTQRWHSESPCGLRERQDRWRKSAAASS